MPAGQKRRQEGGGRSVRYSERRAQRGTTVSHAPVWTDGAALAVQRQVQELTSHRPDQSVANQLGVILSATVEVELFMTSLRMGPNDTVSARAVLLWHAARLANVPCPRERFKCCRNISRVLRERTRGMPASAKAPPPRPSRAPLSPSPRKMTKHVAGAAKANEEERERAKWQKFSAEEDETLRKARTQPGWTWKGIASQLPGRSEQVAHDRWRLLLQRGQAEVAPPSIKRWSAQEDATLRKACGEPGLTWEGITLQLPGRSEQAAVERWRLLQDQQAAPRQRSSWSAQEDDTLRKARTQPGWTWNGIASQLPGKSEFAAKYRWQLLQRGQSEVAPPSSRDWSAQEDATLSKARRQPGWTWEGIASQLSGRSEGAAQKRWRLIQEEQTAPQYTSNSKWSAQEDATIRKARAKPGWTWRGITSQLPGRSHRAASEHLRQLQRAQSRQTAGEEGWETEDGSGTEEGRETEEETERRTEEGRETEEERELEEGSGTEEERETEDGSGTGGCQIWSAREDHTLRQGVEELPGRSAEGIRARWTSKIQQTVEARQGASGGSSSAVVTIESAAGAGGETANAHKRQRTTLTQHRRTTQSVTPASLSPLSPLSPLSHFEARVLTFGEQPVAAEVQKRRTATYEAVAPSEERASKRQSRQEESVTLTAPVCPRLSALTCFSPFVTRR